MNELGMMLDVSHAGGQTFYDVIAITTKSIAAVADYYANGFKDRFSDAVKIAEEFISRIKNNSHFQVQRVVLGGNIFRKK